MLNCEKTPAATLISQRRSPPLTNATSSPSPMLASVPVTVGDLTQSQVAKKWACLGSAMSGAKRRVTSCAPPGTATVASNASTSKTGFTEQVYEATQERARRWRTRVPICSFEGVSLFASGPHMIDRRAFLQDLGGAAAAVALPHAIVTQQADLAPIYAQITQRHDEAVQL